MEIDCACAVPLGAESVSAVVTGWKATSGKPGSKMRVDYQLSSNTPVTEIDAILNGVVQQIQVGLNLTDSAGMWFIAPASGTYSLTVRAVNAYGCERVATALFPVVVK